MAAGVPPPSCPAPSIAVVEIPAQTSQMSRLRPCRRDTGFYLDLVVLLPEPRPKLVPDSFTQIVLPQAVRQVSQ